MVKCNQCEKQASYGFTKLESCTKHREEGMTDLKHKKCLFDSCKKNPTFGLPSDKSASYCKAHAEEGMIDKVSKMCLINSCNRQPSFGLPSDKIASFCKTHAKKGMVDIKNKKCLVDSCNKQPIFGLPSDKSASYCKTHAEKGMVDLKSKRCLFESCDKQPSFGLPSDKSASYCKTHAEEGMIDLAHKKCLVDSCNIRPSFGLPSDKSASFCKTHAEKEMVDIKSKKCKLCNLTQAHIQSYCSPCFYSLNPEHIKTKRHKTRENTFMYQLKEIYPDIILDKTVVGGCSQKRPDGLIDLLTHSIIIEIDENQHRGYSCENKRSMELFQDLGSRPIIFIRLNPDGYTSNGKKKKGCFTLSKTNGELVHNKKEISERFNVLLETIDECKAVPDKTVTIVELYFDE
jgi:hypothetical protein